MRNQINDNTVEQNINKGIEESIQEDQEKKSREVIDKTLQVVKMVAEPIRLPLLISILKVITDKQIEVETINEKLANREDQKQDPLILISQEFNYPKDKLNNICRVLKINEDQITNISLCVASTLQELLLSSTFDNLINDMQKSNALLGKQQAEILSIQNRLDILEKK